MKSTQGSDFRHFGLRKSLNRFMSRGMLGESMGMPFGFSLGLVSGNEHDIRIESSSLKEIPPWFMAEFYSQKTGQIDQCEGAALMIPNVDRRSFPTMTPAGVGASWQSLEEPCILMRSAAKCNPISSKYE